MFPILYESITAGTIPQHNGLGILTDCVSCKVEQERNGVYELTMEYAMNGIHAEDIAERRILKIKPNPTDEPQLFRIDRVGKVMNGKFTCYAKHISYDLSGYEITSGTASSATEACALLQSKANGYSITTDKTVSATFKITEPSSVKSWFAGKEGSFLDVFGTAELKYNNFNIQFLLHAGEDRGETIRYGKNLLELSQEISDTLYTDVLCFWRNDVTVITGNKVSTGLTLDVPKCLIVDCSQDYENAPSVTDLTNKATAYINSHNLTTPSNNIKLDFAQSKELTERVDLCDTVSIYYEALGITRVGVKCIRTVYDAIREKYVETEFGDAIQSFADKMAINNKKIENIPTSTAMQEAIDHATKLITGNLGGNIILHDSDGDGEPDEILVMDTDDISTATNVWRWNKNGLGHSTSYSGSYGLALTYDGQIVATKITTGVLNADLIKAGTISDTSGNSSIDMTSGQAILRYFKAKNTFTLIDSNNVERATLGYTSESSKWGTRLRLKNSSGTVGIEELSTSDSNNIKIYTNSGYDGIEMGCQDSASGVRGNIHILLYSGYSGGSNTIKILGDNGNITCVSLTQTSSRKVKKNIKPIKDSEKILDIQAVSFDFKAEEQGKDKRGFIAEDVAKVLPNLVTEGDVMSLDYIGMIPYLQDVIKKQEKRIEALEEKIEKLYNKTDKGE